jgi:hypothetical protein
VHPGMDGHVQVLALQGGVHVPVHVDGSMHVEAAP